MNRIRTRGARVRIVVPEYYEGIQKQGYTNQGQLLGDWIGREDKGGHLSPERQRATSGGRAQSKGHDVLRSRGTTLNEINFHVVERIVKGLEINGRFAVDEWSAPIYIPGQHSVTTTTSSSLGFLRKS